MDTPSLGPELFRLGWTIAGLRRDKAPVGPTSNLLPQRVHPASRTLALFTGSPVPANSILFFLNWDFLPGSRGQNEGRELGVGGTLERQLEGSSSCSADGRLQFQKGLEDLGQPL